MLEIMSGKFVELWITVLGRLMWGERMKMTSEFDFTLTFAVPGSISTEVLETQLFEAGCDDAIIGLGQKGRLALNFSREAESAEAAVMTAFRDVKIAVPEAKLVEAGPDLVGISDMARLLAFSRQNMRKLIQTNLVSFPLPLHEGAAAIWHLADVLSWFSQSQKRDIPYDLMSVAQVTMSVNLAREADRVDPGVSAQMKDIA